jgi:hypothetical protein
MNEEQSKAFAYTNKLIDEYRKENKMLKDILNNILECFEDGGVPNVNYIENLVKEYVDKIGN